MSHLIDQLRVMKGKAYKEIAQLGCSLHKRRRDILAFFDRGVSNGPVEAINGRLEHLRGIALGFKNLNHYILRCLIHSGGLTNKINALQNRKSHQRHQICLRNTPYGWKSGSLSPSPASAAMAARTRETALPSP